MTTTKPWKQSVDPEVPPNTEENLVPQRAKKKGLLGRFWLILTIVAVVALSGFVVHRLHGVFGVHRGSFGGGTSGEVLDEFNAKTITLEVWGSPGSTATINYLDENMQMAALLPARRWRCSEKALDRRRMSRSRAAQFRSV